MRKGFTLVEVLVSLTMIGLLFGFGYANFRDFSRRQALEGAARTLKGDLRLAQGKASAGEKPSGCLGNLSGYKFAVVSDASYTITAICNTSSVLIKTVPLEGITMTASPISQIIFKVLGQGTDIESSPMVITLTQTGTGNVATVTITQGGEIK